MRMPVRFFAACLLPMALLSAHAEEYDGRYLATVRAHLDALIEHGRDRYGRHHSPQFVADISLDTRTLPDNPPPAPPGASDYDSKRYSFGGANLYWDILTLRSLYLVSEITGEQVYAQAATDSLDYFIRYAQSPYTGLYAWGEHAFWDLLEEHDALDDPKERWRWFGENRHEFESITPPLDLLWQRSPDSVRRFAQGIHDWHIHDYDTFVFDRHAPLYNSQQPGAPLTPEMKRPPKSGPPQSWQRHAGLYSYCFAFLHARTREEQYAQWALGLSDLFWNMRDPETNLSYTCLTRDDVTGAVIPEARQTGRGILDQQAYWMLQASSLMPEHPAGETLRERGLAYMRAWRDSTVASTGMDLWRWSSPQGALQGPAFVLAYRLSGEEEFVQWLSAWSAAAFLRRPERLIEGEWHLFPEHYGRLIISFIQLHKTTGDAETLERARILADEAIALLQHESGLFHVVARVTRTAGTTSTERFAYYNNHTGAQTLLYALTQLHLVKSGSAIPIDLNY